jgi:hypothetical protein
MFDRLESWMDDPTDHRLVKVIAALMMFRSDRLGLEMLETDRYYDLAGDLFYLGEPAYDDDNVDEAQEWHDYDPSC